MATFKPRRFYITIETPEEGDHFLRGLIIARQNNSSEYFTDLIDAVNEILEPWRMEQIMEVKQLLEAQRKRVAVRKAREAAERGA
jgi:hypothetical protein